MTLNITSQMSPEEILSEAHTAIGKPSLMLASFIFIFLSLIIGLISFDTSTGKKKFFKVWLASTLVGLILIIFLYNSPSMIENLWGFFSNL